MDDDTGSLTMLDLLVGALISMIVLLLIVAAKMMTGGVADVLQKTGIPIRASAANDPTDPVPSEDWAICSIEVLFWPKASGPPMMEQESSIMEQKNSITISNPRIHSTDDFIHQRAILFYAPGTFTAPLTLPPPKKSISGNWRTLGALAQSNGSSVSRVALLRLLRRLHESADILNGEDFFRSREPHYHLGEGSEGFTLEAMKAGALVGQTASRDTSIYRSSSEVVLEVWARLVQARAYHNESEATKREAAALAFLQDTGEALAALTSDSSWLAATKNLTGGHAPSWPILLLETRTSIGRSFEIFVFEESDDEYGGIKLNLQDNVVTLEPQ